MKTPQKYQFQYSKDDYPYNTQYRREAPKEGGKPQQPKFYLEIVDNKVQQVTDQLAQQIAEGIRSASELSFVRVTEIGGHCIDLRKMLLINVLTGHSRKIFMSLEPHQQLIARPKTCSPEAPTGKFFYVPVHWYERINHKYRPLQLSISDIIEKFYQKHTEGKCGAVYEFTWQQYRFIVDLTNMTLQNCRSNEINHIQRRNVKEISKKHDYQNHSFDEKDFQWQYCLFDFGQRRQSWQNYDPQNNQQLEKRYKKFLKNNKKSNSFAVVKQTSKMYIDFLKMIEYCPITKSAKLIRRVQPESGE